MKKPKGELHKHVKLGFCKVRDGHTILWPPKYKYSKQKLPGLPLKMKKKTVYQFKNDELHWYYASTCEE